MKSAKILIIVLGFMSGVASAQGFIKEVAGNNLGNNGAFQHDSYEKDSFKQNEELTLAVIASDLRLMLIQKPNLKFEIWETRTKNMIIILKLHRVMMMSTEMSTKSYAR